MYISLAQISVLDKIVKGFEVALRSFVAEGLHSRFATVSEFTVALQKITFPGEVIYSRKFEAKIKGFIKNASLTHSGITNSATSLNTGKFDSDVPYVSDVIDLLLIFFNDVFSAKNIARRFSTIEEFHYCASLYHLIRNNLSHPASRPIDESDAAKVLYFVSNLCETLDDSYFWYSSKHVISSSIAEYKGIDSFGSFKVENLNFSSVSYKQLLSRDLEIDKLYAAIIGNEERKRIAGSVVIYGYGGVGKTAISTEFLLRILRDKKDGKHSTIDFVLFYSSKDEYLRSSDSTGMFYIDESTPQFSTLDELKRLIFSSLQINAIEEISKYQRGIIVVDNVENIAEVEKRAVLDFIKATPRNIQFILTSRSEEPCEEKIHVEEFTNNEFGLKFVADLIETEGFDLELDEAMIRRILDVSKGNALIILQILNSLSRRLSTFDDTVRSLESFKSTNSESIANFMYKNTFDGVLRELGAKGYPVEKVIQIISLYEEPIELYSISKLAEVEIQKAEELCNVLLQRLILVKSGEYYELNEFAKRFVFIKLLPDKISLRKVKGVISDHKKRMAEKLTSLERALEKKYKLRTLMSEWQPRNYIDKIVIAETFSLYLDAAECVGKKDRTRLEEYVDEFAEHKVRTNHPYISFQEARLLKLRLLFREPVKDEFFDRIENAYEEAIEAIEFDCRYLLHTPAHASLLMLYGIFLALERKRPDRAIRYLEDAKKIAAKKPGKVWFMSSHYLARCYKSIFESGVVEYLESLKIVCAELLPFDGKIGKKVMDMGKFKREFEKYLPA